MHREAVAATAEVADHLAVEQRGLDQDRRVLAVVPAPESVRRELGGVG
jgi:hypothetical protein